MVDPVSSPGGVLRTDDRVNTVQYSLFCGDVSGEFVVTAFDATEELNRPYHIVLALSTGDAASDANELLGRDVRVAIAREEHLRELHGIVCRVTIEDTHHTDQRSTVEIAPALGALAYTTNTRIFQDQSALDIVETVLGDGLRPYQREVDSTSLDRTAYLGRNYCVQYDESDLDFVHRLLEEEGIGYCFAQDGPEKIVLFSSNAQIARVVTMDGAPVSYDASGREWIGAEPVVAFSPTRQIGSTSRTVRDHDWTRGNPTIEESSSVPAAERNNSRGEHEVYEHGFRHHITIRENEELLANLLRVLQNALLPGGVLPPGLEHMVYDLPGAVLGSFSSSDLSHQLAIRTELARRDATRFRGAGVVTDFACGKRFELTDHPTAGSDGEYLITKVVHTSRRPEVESLPLSHASNYHNRFECLPIATPWRPDRRTRKPRVYGVQTAKVTGPIGMDLYTDAQGRIKVRFQWDRAATDNRGNYTCWLRVSQTWAGHGSPGFMFIPRVGMEVVVSFVDGDPDRPLVTGCVYNGENPTPGLLPIQATKSIIRTRTVPHGPGHNELSFEDAMGMERVHIRAERDLDELVLNEHRTEVRANQSNTVGGDQFETVGRHQNVLVMGNQSRQVEGSITEHSGSNFLRGIGGSGTEQYGGSYQLSVEQGSAYFNVIDGDYVAAAKKSLTLLQNNERMIKLASEGDEKGILINSQGSLIHVEKDRIVMKVGQSKITITDAGIQVNQKSFPPSGG